MKKISIITDSASDMQSSKSDGVSVLPMVISFGDDEYQDGVTITHREFYEKLLETEVTPVTSLIAPAVFENAFQQAVDAGERVIVITISSKLSGTWQSAVLAAKGFEGKVFVIDSLNASVGERILVERAKALIAQGLDVSEIVDKLEREKKEIHVVALLDTLEYLRRGGRISKTVAFVGGILSVKPVVQIKDGEVVMLGAVRGSRNSNNYLIKEIQKANGVDFARPLCLGYTGISDALLQKYILDSHLLWNGHEACMRTCTIGATIGTHAGPGTIAVAFFAKEK